MAFFREPSLQSFLGGLTIYGGLIVGGLAVAWYARRVKIPFLHLADATAPGLILAYGIGRMGCQISGDGDWGIPNPTPSPIGSPGRRTGCGPILPQQRQRGLRSAPRRLHRQADHGERPLADFRRLRDLPRPGVYPTSFYETIMATAIFAFLWSMRKRWKTPGFLFGVYLMFNGVERFFIEKIRVNAEMDWLGITFTQAEMISTLDLPRWFRTDHLGVPQTKG